MRTEHDSDLPPEDYRPSADRPLIGDAADLLPAVTVGSLAERDKAAAFLLGDDSGARVLANIRNQAATPTRNAQWANLYAEIVGWKGTKQQVIAWIMEQLGCGVQVAQDAVRQLQQAPSDPHEIARMMLAYGDWYFGPNGPAEKPDNLRRILWPPDEREE